MLEKDGHLGSGSHLGSAGSMDTKRRFRVIVTLNIVWVFFVVVYLVSNTEGVWDLTKHFSKIPLNTKFFTGWAESSAAGSSYKVYVEDFYQVGDHGIFLRQGFYDERFGERKLRFFGMQYTNTAAIKLACRVQISGTTIVDMPIIKREIYSLWPNKNAKMHAFSYKCSLRKNMLTPRKVKVVALVRNETGVVIPILDLPEEKDSPLAVCVETTNGIIDGGRLVEWIEFNRLLGVDKLIFYNTAYQSTSREVLDYYQRLGVVDVEDFPYPLIMHKFAKDVFHGEVDENHILHQANLVMLNDCLYRYRRKHEFIAVLKIDQIIIPMNYGQNLVNVSYTASKIFPLFQSLNFKHSWHAFEYGAVFPNSRLLTQKYLRRTPPNTINSKSIFQSKNALVVNWHGPVEKGKKVKFIVDLNANMFGYVHSFRKCIKELTICYDHQKSFEVDTIVPQYRKSLEERTNAVIKKIGLEQR